MIEADRTETDRKEYIVLRKFLEKEKLYGSGESTIQDAGRGDGFYQCCIQVWVRHGSEEEQQKGCWRQITARNTGSRTGKCSGAVYLFRRRLQWSCKCDREVCRCIEVFKMKKWPKNVDHEFRKIPSTAHLQLYNYSI